MGYIEDNAANLANAKDAATLHALKRQEADHNLYKEGLAYGGAQLPAAHQAGFSAGVEHAIQGLAHMFATSGDTNVSQVPHGTGVYRNTQFPRGGTLEQQLDFSNNNN